jgi:two-component system, NtrC family, sensor kinase
MLQELKFQVSTAVLTVITVAAIVAAVLNFGQLGKFHLADDGATWVEEPVNGHAAVVAYRVAAGGGAERAGIRKGDILAKINNGAVRTAVDVPQILLGVGPWNRAEYLIERKGVLVPVKVIIGEAAHDSALYFQYFVGAAYLLIGLFVYFRRGSAHKAQHFFIYCLVSFIFSCFHYTGKLNTFDKIIYWGNIIAGWLAPTLFLHFCLTFPEPRRWFRRYHAPLLYVPGAIFTVVFIGITSGYLQTSVPLVQLSWYLDRVWMALLTVLYLLSCMTLALECRRTEDPILRPQLKWLRNGTFFGLVPFALFYATPYILGITPGPLVRFSVFSLILVPLTLAYAIVRYRLMDVDVIFRRGYAYTLATLCILAGFYGVILALGNLFNRNFKEMGSIGVVTVMLLTAFLFQPLRNWMQERIDKYFYQERYDYRRTLIEFARELNAEVDLDKMLASAADRLMQTLSIRQIGFFLESDKSYKIAKLVGSSGRWAGDSATNQSSEQDLSFLNWERPTPYIFFERTRYRLDALAQTWAPTVRQTIADLDLTYYIPCSVRGRTIAFIGVSRTETGDFLSSDDLELLVTLSGYVGIAVENANLYQSLQRKVDDYEKLKEFSENIVESINVGILAADLEDCVESWNTRMEELTGVLREQAVGQRLAHLLPPVLMEHLNRLRGDMSIHHLDKIPLPYTRRTDQRDITVNIAVAPLISRGMEQIGRLIIFDDITDRADLERRLIQADKLSSIGLLAAGVAHEVNTPLAVISTYAQMLTKQVGDDEQKSRMLDKIAKQTFRASEIVNSLLNFSRTSTTELTEVSLNKVVQETLSLLEHQFKSANLTVQLSLDVALPSITGNAGKLQQVFLNLFLNARDAMEPGGVLSIESGSDEALVRVDVADTGHGIAPEHLARIYDPFFTTKAARKGTGLGLSVSYGIIQEHGGTIEVISRPGGGTRFRLELPRVRKNAPEAESSMVRKRVVNA